VNRFKLVMHQGNLEQFWKIISVVMHELLDIAHQFANRAMDGWHKDRIAQSSPTNPVLALGRFDPKTKIGTVLILDFTKKL
jgi:hypothetical protein